MKLEKTSFQHLPFSNLFRTYISDFQKLNEFYPTNPFSEEEIKRKAHRVKKTETHSEVVNVLEAFHEKLGIDQAEQLEKLRDEKALTIVTGQQLGIYGGPLFTIYKTITTILLAKQLEEKLSRPIVPVFWLADEDHDFEEVIGFGIPGNDDFIKVTYGAEGGKRPVSDEVFESELEQFKSSLKEEMFDTDFSDDLWEDFNSWFKEGVTFREAFAKMMDAIFGKYGLLIAGSHDKGIKNLLVDTLKKSMSENDRINSLLEDQSDKIKEVFHQQVTIGDSNLFWINEDGHRIKIERNGSGWTADENHWTEEELSNEISNNPEKFSPNVFLRPIIQDKILPTLGYVAGPGEVAYYAQMKTLYEFFDLEMPVIFPRISGTLVESGINRILEKLPFEWYRYGDRIEDLEKEYAKKSEETDVEKVFADWISDLKDASEKPRNIIAEIDGSLDGMTGKTISGFENEINKLKGRVYRSIKQQEQTQLQRIQKIKAQLFPDDGLQERMISFMYFMNKYGLDIWDQLIQELEKDELDLQNHHIVCL